MSDLRLLSIESLFLASVSGLLTIKSLAGLGLTQAFQRLSSVGELLLTVTVTVPSREAELSLRAQQELCYSRNTQCDGSWL
eukprot:COSAG01_NODE_296_length_19281_cov_212.029507_11_plen_81_part_00